MLALDQLLLNKVFTPIAHWIDYRFHKNHYALAALAMLMGATLSLANAALDIVSPGAMMGALGSLLFAIGAGPLILAARQASADYERGRNTPSFASLLFHSIWSVFWRVVLMAQTLAWLAVLGIFVWMAHRNVAGLVNMLYGFDIPIMGAGLYFGAVQRPTHRRKERRWSTAFAPQGA